jgi:phage protein D
MPELFAPTFSLKIDGARAELDVEKTVSSLVVTDENETIGSFDLTLVNAFPELRWTHGPDADVFRVGAGVVIEMGYVGALKKMFAGEITSIGPDFPFDGVPTVAIKGHTRGHALSQTNKTRTFVEKTDSEIATEIAHDLNLKADVQPTTERHPYLIQFRRTDLDFLRERARRIGYRLGLDGDTLQFGPGDGMSDATFTLVWAGGQLGYDPGGTAMPLRSFKPTVNTMRQPTKVVVRGIDHHTGTKIEETATDTSPPPSPGAITGPAAAATAGRDLEPTFTDIPFANADEAKTLARSLLNYLASQFVTATGSTIGLPDLRAGSVVQIGGLGQRFDGPYFVTSSTHSITARGYTTEFSVKRNWVG